MLRNKQEIPEKPGVYLFKSAKDNILYIGKARNLNKRINQYFQIKDNPVVNNLLSQTIDIEFIITDDEKDALHLEYNLIHNYQPNYNIRLKDDKTFPFIKITTAEEFPGIYYSRRLDNSSFSTGPITNAKKTKIIIDIITRLFKLRTCSNTVFKKGNACLYFYIEQCSAPCLKKIEKKKYQSNVKDAIEILKGKKNKITVKLKKKMNQFARELKFEEAQKIKEDIDLIDKFIIDSYITSSKDFYYDVISLYQEKNEVFIILFSIIEGRVKRREFFNFNTISFNDKETLKNFLLSFYWTNNIPNEINVPFFPEDLEHIKELFSQLARKKIKIKIPLKGNKKKMLDFAWKNLQFYRNKKDFNLIGTNMKKFLHLSQFPNIIEGYDISHLSERDRVGAVVVFKAGKALKAAYRNYIIKKAQAGDTEAIKEILQRRFEKTRENPNLMIIDGGKSQLNVAKKIKNKLKIKSDIISIAKGKEKIYLENGDVIILPGDNPVRFFIQNIRDEAHRRALNFHTKRRQAINIKKQK